MPGPLSCLLITAISANVVEAAVGADGEVAAGRAPIDITGPEENSVTFTLVPGAGLRWRTDDDSLALSYTPRIFYRLPNALSVERPLVLHQVSLAEQSKLSRRLEWTSAAKLSIGEVDYTAAGVVFDPRVSSVVRTSVADVLRAEAETGFKIGVSPRLRLDWDFSGDYTTPINEGSAPPVDPAMAPPEEPVELTRLGDAVPESAQLSTQASLSYQVTHYDHVATAAMVTYQWFPDTGRYLLLSPDVSWDSQLSRRTSIGVSAGLAYVITLEANEGVDDSNAIGGTGSFRVGSVVYKTRETTVSSSMSASLDWFFDPIAGTSQPRAGVDVGTNIELGRKWLITPNAAFYTVLRGARARVGGTTPDDGMGDDMMDVAPSVDLVTPDSTLLRGELPVRYAVTPEVSVSFGARAALRGRALSDDGFRLDEQVEVWAFFGLTVRLATSHDDGSWLPL